MGKAKPIDVERARELLRYDPETGILHWRTRRVAPGAIGAPAGRPDGKGYHRIGLDGVRYFTHRVVWAIVYGDPASDVEIDHINGDGLDNRLTNLRLATPFQNQQNITRLSSANTSGTRGVRFKADKNCYMAQIRIGKRAKHLGCFQTEEEAAAAYAAAERLHRPFAQVNTRSTIEVTF